MTGLNIAVVGATGSVGREILSLLSERSFPVLTVVALASKRSAGQEISFGEQSLPLRPLSDYDFRGIDLVFFCAGSSLAEKYIPQITSQGALVIDKSSAFRLDPDVPLCIPELNQDVLMTLKRGIVASPNCIAIPLALTVAPLMSLSPLKRLVVSTYQSVSGAGYKGMEELHHQTRSLFVNESLSASVFSKQIAFNVIPHIDSPMASGHSGEEEKVMFELKKILTPSLKIAITCVRVPVFIGHAMSVCAEFQKALSPQDAARAFKQEKHLSLYDSPQDDKYMTPLDCAGEDSVFISRLRKDSSVDHGLNFWVAADNLRKGAALNALHIAESLVKRKVFKGKGGA